jgi:hypothetical protein
MFDVLSRNLTRNLIWMFLFFTCQLYSLAGSHNLTWIQVL